MKSSTIRAFYEAAVGCQAPSVIARCGNVGIRSVDFHISTRRVLAADRHIMLRPARGGLSQPSIRVALPRGQSRRSM